MKFLDYTRVSSDKPDLQKQEHLLLKYTQQQDLRIQDFIYSYFAEAEREFISIRTEQGLAAAKASGKKLGRPKGSRDKERILDPHREQIKEYLYLGLSLRRIRTIINPQLERPISYLAYRYFVRQDPELLQAWEADR